jgi:Anti-sigma regulatory factor (Ser/Thr protein kinase)
MFTDGLTESRDENNRSLDVSGLIKLIQSNPRLTVAKRLENIIARIRRPGVNQRDDITLLVIDCTPKDITESLFRQHFKASPDQLCEVRAQVRRAAELKGCDAVLTDNLVLAVNEACMNVIQHAYRDDPEGEILLEILNNGNGLLFRLEDHAEPVDLASVKPRELDQLRPGGLGVHFIREIMDEWKMGHLEGGAGNYLEMIKRIR